MSDDRCTRHDITAREPANEMLLSIAAYKPRQSLNTPPSWRFSRFFQVLSLIRSYTSPGKVVWALVRGDCLEIGMNYPLDDHGKPRDDDID